uniref:Hexose transporter n=1 Tax=Solanum tuberosum TaxID=4113 RepID=M1DY92_SOLTU
MQTQVTRISIQHLVDPVEQLRVSDNYEKVGINLLPFTVVIMNFFIGLYFLSIVTKFGISTMYMRFALSCLVVVVYIFGNVVETKGRSLEEIERLPNCFTTSGGNIALDGSTFQNF